MSTPHTYPTTALLPTLVRRDDAMFTYEHKAGPGSCQLDLLTYGAYKLPPGGRSDTLCHWDQETLLFSVAGEAQVTIEGRTLSLPHYDVLYVPIKTPYVLSNPGKEPARLLVCKAPATTQHPMYHASWKSVAKDERRIRHLKGKDVFLMFDVSEPADHLIAGYTIYEPNTRAWPPHNHTDQEEVYIFTKGNGAMEVYADEETKTFVTSLNEGDAATIPVLNYHPVFSQDEEVHFIWCISGERYWVGDKNKAFMKGEGKALTT